MPVVSLSFSILAYHRICCSHMYTVYIYTELWYIISRLSWLMMKTYDSSETEKKWERLRQTQFRSYLSNERSQQNFISTFQCQERLADSDCFSRGVLLDGFPRTRAQAGLWVLNFWGVIFRWCWRPFILKPWFPLLAISSLGRRNRFKKLAWTSLLWFI